MRRLGERAHELGVRLRVGGGVAVALELRPVGVRRRRPRRCRRPRGGSRAGRPSPSGAVSSATLRQYTGRTYSSSALRSRSPSSARPEATCHMTRSRRSAETCSPSGLTPIPWTTRRPPGRELVGARLEEGEPVGGGLGRRAPRALRRLPGRSTCRRGSARWGCSRSQWAAFEHMPSVDGGGGQHLGEERARGGRGVDRGRPGVRGSRRRRRRFERAA